MVWSVVVLAFGLALLSFLLWLEWTRRNKAWRLIRVLCSVLAVGSLACLALPISSSEKIASGNSKSIVLLTEGYNADTLRQVLKRNKIDAFYTVDKTIKAPNTVYLPDLDTINGQGTSVHMLGNGLNRQELESLGKTNIRFYPSAINNNFLNIGWQQKLPSGEPLIVQGRFNNAFPLPVKLVLSGFGVNLDSISVAANKSSTFQLRTVPAHLDKAVYSITALKDNDTLASEPIPLEVHTTQPLRILMLAASPDFENKFLRNWLAEKGFQFAIKTTISANKFDKDYNNLPIVSLDRITPSLLDRFDLMIGDVSALAKLPSGDLALVRNYVENKGLGLVVKTDSLVQSSAFYSAPFPLAAVRDSVQHVLKIRLADENRLAAEIKVEQPVYIKSRPGTKPLAFDQQARIVASTSLYGTGNLVATTIPNTYLWQLSGNQTDYNAYWTTLLTRAARKTPVTNKWTVTPAMPSINEEVHLQLQTSAQTIPQVQVGESAVYMEQDPHQPSGWTGKFWPTKKGWLPILTGDGSSTWWYVYDQKDWSGVKGREKIEATKRYANSQRSQTAPSSTAKEIKTEVPKIYFLALFLICCGVLWVEKKLHRS